MKYLGWFLFNVIVFVWSLTYAIPHNAFKHEGLSAWVAVLSGIILVIFTVFGSIEIIGNIVNAIRRHRKKIKEIHEFLEQILSISVSTRGFLSTHHALFLETLPKKQKNKGG